MTRIGPGITEMQVQIRRHTLRLHPLGQLDIIVQIIRPVTRVDPHALADRVDPTVSQDFL